MKPSEYESHDALGLAEAVRRGDVSPEALLETAIRIVEARDPDVNAVIDRMYDQARTAIAAGLPRGPLRGVPFLIKDLHAGCAGTRTTNGCRLFEDFVAPHDSELVARYRRAGLVLFGKTHSPEFGLTTSTETRLFGQTRNPWNRAHTSGGSSGGASAAVAARMLPAAHASDGGGSIRIPASCCGLFGLKPTRARTPMGPDVGEGWSGMSTQHAVTRSVRDSAALLDATHGPALGDPYEAPRVERPYLQEIEREPGRVRIAVLRRAFNGANTHPECLAALEDAAALCLELGHDVRDGALEIDAQALAEAGRVIIGSSLLATLEDRAAALGRPLAEGDTEPITWAMTQGARSVGAAQYVRALRAIHALGRRVARAFEDCDVLLTPTMAAPPAELGTLSLSTSDLPAFMAALNASVGYTQLFNASGNPAASVPLYWSESSGLPIGTQLVGRFGDEATLFRLSAQLERARPWFERAPHGLAAA